MISSVKKLPECRCSWQDHEHFGLRLKDCAGKNEVESGCAAAKQGLNTSPKGADAVPMQYDVLTPDKKPLGGLIPWTAKYNTGK